MFGSFNWLKVAWRRFQRSQRWGLVERRAKSVVFARVPDRGRRFQRSQRWGLVGRRAKSVFFARVPALRRRFQRSQRSGPYRRRPIESCGGSNLDFREVAFLLEPLATIGRALLGEQHVHELVRLVRRLDRELHQAPRARIDGGLT
jgi:hypothetical protein